MRRGVILGRKESICTNCRLTISPYAPTITATARRTARVTIRFRPRCGMPPGRSVAGVAVSRSCSRGRPASPETAEAMSSRPRSRELTERSSSGMRVRLLWLPGTRHLWVEVREPDDRVLAIPVQPERALDAFHHPYAYAGAR
jgi:hypothetical protein